MKKLRALSFSQDSLKWHVPMPEFRSEIYKLITRSVGCPVISSCSHFAQEQ